MSKMRSGIELSERMASLEAKVEAWIENTSSYREQKDHDSRELSKKIDVLINKSGELPCKGHTMSLSALTAIVTIIIGAIAAGHIWR